MDKIGIFFGTDTGTTRLIAKKMAKKLDGLADKPINVNRIELEDMLKYDSLILGTPTYGVNQLPGLDTKIKDGSWAEFVPKLEGADLGGKTVALYGLGNQEKYPGCFADSLFKLYEIIKATGATIVGGWPTEGYEYQKSQAEVDGQFVGLVLDNVYQPIFTDERIDAWLQQVKPLLTQDLRETA